MRRNRLPVADQMPVQQSLQHQRHHTNEHMHLDFLVGPVILGTDRNVPDIFHVSKCALNMVLCAIAMHDLRIGPLGAVSEDEILAQQRALQAPPCGPVETVFQLRNVLGARFHRDLKQLFHMPGFQTLVNLAPRPGQRRAPALGDDALLPTPQLPLNVLEFLAPFCNLAQQRGSLCPFQILVFCNHHRVLFTVQLLGCAPDTHALDLGERLEPARRYREQIRMLGGNQGADHMIGTVVHCRNIVLAIVALVEDQR